MKTFPRNSPVTCEFPWQRPVTRSFDIFFHLCLNKRLNKQSWGWWLETPSRSLWRACNGSMIKRACQRQRWDPLGRFNKTMSIYQNRNYINSQYKDKTVSRTSHHYNALQWRQNGRDSVSNHQPHDCLLNRLFRRRSKKTSKLRVTGLCCGEFTGDRWIPRTNGQLRGKCFHLMTSLWAIPMLVRWRLYIEPTDRLHFQLKINIPHLGCPHELLSVFYTHDDVIKWKHFPRYWPFVRGIHRSPVNSPHKGQWRGALMFSLICSRITGWVNNREAGDLRRHHAHYDVIVMVLRRKMTVIYRYPDSKVHGVNMGRIWSQQDPSGHHVGPMNLAAWGAHCIEMGPAFRLSRFQWRHSILALRSEQGFRRARLLFLLVKKQP